MKALFSVRSLIEFVVFLILVAIIGYQQGRLNVLKPAFDGMSERWEAALASETDCWLERSALAEEQTDCCLELSASYNEQTDCVNARINAAQIKIRELQNE